MVAQPFKVLYPAPLEETRTEKEKPDPVGGCTRTSSLTKFGFSVGFVRFANVPESEGMVCIGTILLFFLFVFQLF